jgi:hypothetical protein
MAKAHSNATNRDASGKPNATVYTQKRVSNGVKGSNSITGKLCKVAYINASSNYDRDEVDLAMASKQEAFAAKLAQAKKWSKKTL